MLEKKVSMKMTLYVQRLMMTTKMPPMMATKMPCRCPPKKMPPQARKLALFWKKVRRHPSSLPRNNLPNHPESLTSSLLPHHRLRRLPPRRLAHAPAKGTCQSRWHRSLSKNGGHLSCLDRSGLICLCVSAVAHRMANGLALRWISSGTSTSQLHCHSSSVRGGSSP